MTVRTKQGGDRHRRLPRHRRRHRRALAGDGFTVVINYSGNAAPAEALARRIEQAGGPRHPGPRPHVSDPALAVRPHVRGGRDRLRRCRRGGEQRRHHAAGAHRRHRRRAVRPPHRRQPEGHLQHPARGGEAPARRRPDHQLLDQRRRHQAGELRRLTPRPRPASRCSPRSWRKSCAGPQHHGQRRGPRARPGPTCSSTASRRKLVERFAKATPLERLGTPQDIAAVVAFLAGPDGGWVNGQVLRANGGLV